jgi:hypothetical protein
MNPNPKKAFGDKKVPVHLVPPALLIETAVAFKEGRKYGPFNWRASPVEATTYIGAMYRHLMAYQDGEDLDPESTEGKTHLAGIAACCAILMDANAHGSLIDNRTPGPAPKLIRYLTASPVADAADNPQTTPRSQPRPRSAPHYGVNF